MIYHHGSFYCYSMANDIDFSGYLYPRAPIQIFAGRLDGKGHTLANLKINGHGNLGLIGSLRPGGSLFNLHVGDVNIIGQDHYGYMGGLVGENFEGDIVRCSVTGHLFGTSAIAGLVANNIDGNIMNCQTQCSIHGSDFLGGLVAWNDGQIIRSSAECVINAVNIGTIQEDNTPFGNIGGLVGNNRRSILDSYATGSITGIGELSSIGGLVGGNMLAFTPSISRCFATTRITVDRNCLAVGGLVGSVHEEKDIHACFWDMDTSGIINSGGGIGLSTHQLQDPNTFQQVGWDLVGEKSNGTAETWLLNKGGKYPQLACFFDHYHPPILQGSGTIEDPYRVSSAEELGAMNHYDLDASYQLEADIDLAGIRWSGAPIPILFGCLNGNGFIVSRPTIDSSDYRVGLVGTIARFGNLANLGIEDANYVVGQGCYSVGVLIGENSGYLKNCYSTGSITGYFDEGGGLVGKNQGSISNCFSHSHIFGSGEDRTTGGLVGRNRGRIHHCYATGRVEGLKCYWSCGGFVGDT